MSAAVVPAPGMPPAWVQPWVGLPFHEKGRGLLGYDCWGLARAVRHEQCGDVLPCYASSYWSTRDALSVSAAVLSGLYEGWQKIAQPRPLCLVILKLAGRPWHCGIMLDARWFLHTTAQTGSVLERIDSLMWRDRVEGFYERKGAC